MDRWNEPWLNLSIPYVSSGSELPYFYNMESPSSNCQALSDCAVMLKVSKLLFQPVSKDCSWCDVLGWVWAENLCDVSCSYVRQDAWCIKPNGVSTALCFVEQWIQSNLAELARTILTNFLANMQDVSKCSRMVQVGLWQKQSITRLSSLSIRQEVRENGDAAMGLMMTQGK
jgi:hypothetical protein